MVTAVVAVKLTVADVPVTLLNTTFCTSLQAGGGVVLKVAVAAVEVAPPPQLLTMFTV